MENLGTIAIIAAAGYIGYRVYKSKKETEKTEAFKALLKMDDPNVSVINKMDINQTAVNLAAVYFRKNKSEVLSTAEALTFKGYINAANILKQYANSL